MDLRELLDVPSDEVKKPPVWPSGTYHGFIEKYEAGKTKEKGTNFLRVILKCIRADESVMTANPEFFANVDVSKRTFRKDFYLMPDKSQHWRLKEMMEKVGINLEGRTLMAGVPELTGKAVKFEVTQKANQDNTELLNEVMDNSISAETD